MAEFELRQPMSQLRISRRDRLQMLDHLEKSLPHEGCGLMAGRDDRVHRIYTIDNRLASPSAYEMDPQQQLEAMLDIEDRGWDLLAIYHSHPDGPAVPSTVDLSTAYYPEAAYVIVSFFHPAQPSVKAFTINRGKIREISLIVD
jgi:proteasome lid subunit RPN8/RPN11